MKSSFLSLWVLFLFFSCNNLKEEQLVFVGDSLISRWDTERFFPTWATENYGVSGAVVNDILALPVTISHSLVVLLIGTNDISRVDYKIAVSSLFMEKFLSGYTSFIEKHPTNRFLILSVLPRNFEEDKYNMNGVIKLLNQKIKERVSTYPNVTFVDVFNNFIATEEKINREYYNDGLHLNYYGYERLKKLIEKYF